MVATAGPEPRHGRDAAVAESKWSRIRNLRSGDHVCGCRLGDVTRHRMVFDDLRVSDVDRAGRFVTGVADHHQRLPVASRTDVARLPAETFSRSGQAVADDGHGLGLLLVLPVTDRMVGQPARRDSVLPGTIPRPVAVDRRIADTAKFRAAVRAAPVARSEAQPAPPDGGGVAADRDALP